MWAATMSKAVTDDGSTARTDGATGPFVQRRIRARGGARRVHLPARHQAAPAVCRRRNDPRHARALRPVARIQGGAE